MCSSHLMMFMKSSFVLLLNWIDIEYVNWLLHPEFCWVLKPCAKVIGLIPLNLSKSLGWVKDWCLETSQRIFTRGQWANSHRMLLKLSTISYIIIKLFGFSKTGSETSDQHWLGQVSHQYFDCKWQFVFSQI